MPSHGHRPTHARPSSRHILATCRCSDVRGCRRFGHQPRTIIALHINTLLRPRTRPPPAPSAAQRLLWAMPERTLHVPHVAHIQRSTERRTRPPLPSGPNDTRCTLVHSWQRAPKRNRQLSKVRQQQQQKNPARPTPPEAHCRAYVVADSGLCPSTAISNPGGCFL